MKEKVKNNKKKKVNVRMNDGNKIKKRKGEESIIYEWEIEKGERWNNPHNNLVDCSDI